MSFRHWFAFVLFSSMFFAFMYAEAQERELAAVRVARNQMKQKMTHTLAFRDALTPPPSYWDGPIFKLSHQYPAQLKGGGEQMPWLKLPVRFDNPNPKWIGSGWSEYMQSILDYIKQDQDPQLRNATGFIVHVNGHTRWFHMPWMTYDESAGREFIHGLTNERTATMQDLDGDGDSEVTGVNKVVGAVGFYETWSVGMFNEYGAYAIGQALPDGKPQYVMGADGKPLLNGMPFPVGTVVAKLLFTSASEQDVAYLKGSPEWQVHRHVHIEGADFSCRREVQASHLLQMDIAVVEPRSPSGWVFGTFAYDGNLEGKTVWERMIPVGVQWGNDPQAWPATSNKEAPIVETIWNDTVQTFQHLGCNNRLNGPADNPQSSCLACHVAAFSAPEGQMNIIGENVLPFFGFDTQCKKVDEENKLSFANRNYPERLEKFPNAIPLDGSMQMFVALAQYKSFSLQGKPLPCLQTKDGN